MPNALTLFRREYPYREITVRGTPWRYQGRGTSWGGGLDVELKLQLAEGEPTRTFGIWLFDVRVGRTNDWAGLVRLAPII